MSDQRTIWTRRVVLMAAIGLLVAIPVTLLVRDGDDEGGGDGDSTVTTAPPEVGKLDFDRKLGVELRLPEGWRRKDEKGDAVSFRSPDRSVLIAVTAPGPAEDYEEIAGAAIDSIESEYRRAEVRDRIGDAKLGGLRTKTVALTAVNPKTGEPIRILLSAAKGDKRAYLVEVFAAGEDPNAALIEAQALLNELRLER